MSETMPETMSTEDGSGPGTTAQPTDAGTSVGSTDGGPPAGAELSFDVSPADFGATPLATRVTLGLTVTNGGGSPATAMTPLLSGPFEFAGGSFPGAGGDCADVLAQDMACTVTLAFAATALGPADGVLSIDYDDGVGAAQVSTEVRAAATGSTGNLITNGDAESCVNNEPTGWNQPVGEWECSEGVDFVEPLGTAMLSSATGVAGDNFVLTQKIWLTDHVAAINTGALTLDFSGWAATWALNNDSYRFHLRYLDERNALVEAYDSGWQSGNPWTEYVDVREVDPTVRSVVVRLLCRKEGGSICDAFFDELRLQATYD